MKNKVINIALASVAAAALLGFTAFAQTTQNISTQISYNKPVDNFRLTDQFSKSHELRYFKNKKAVVIVSHIPNQKNVKEAYNTVKKLAEEHQDIQFFFLNSQPGNALEMVKEDQFTVPVLLDPTQLIGQDLGVTQVAEAFVIETKTWRISYHGPADKNLVDAVSAVSSGEKVEKTSVSMNNPKIHFYDRGVDHSSISYEKEIVPILAKNCVACHSQGGIGPFPMDSYERVKGFSLMIREVIRTDRMPPYNADPHVGTWKADMNLSIDDQRTLVNWIEAGAPRSPSSEDPLKKIAVKAPEWELGTPDLVVTMPEYKIPASGVVDYQYPVVKNPLSEGRWLKASTVKPGDRRAVHHLLSPIGDYAVGAESTIYDEDTGVWVEPGGELWVQLHYTPYGRETVDQSRVGMYFYPAGTEPKVKIHQVVIANPMIKIPPNTARHKEVAYLEFPADATIYSIFPHAHYRGENMQIFLKKPGQNEELILSLPKYDFNWQRGYRFETPLKISAGSKIVTRYEYDNSANNPANPDPNITVTWGEQSHEEMQFTAINFRWDSETAQSQKPELTQLLNQNRTLGLLDKDVSGKIEKAELPAGPMSDRILPLFDAIDKNKDGGLDNAEIAPFASQFNRRAQNAANEFSGQAQSRGN